MQADLQLRRSVQVAHLVREQLAQLAIKRLVALARQAALFLEESARLSAARRKLALGAAWGWSASATAAARQLESAVSNLPFNIQQVTRAAQQRTVPIPSVREIVDDLQQLREEFGGFNYDRDHQCLVAVTEPIELEGVYLGEFEVRLHLDRLAQDQWDRCYSLVALDPNPAAGNSSVTHPHVSDERLCAGDAVAPIRAALGSGRLCDFFQLVRSVLNTYTPGSPYVALDSWRGTPCYDCGYVTDSEDTRWCSSCEQDFCEECSSYCRRCDETTCSGCLAECRVCEEGVCPSCMTRCQECGEALCRSCVDDLACPCHEDQEEKKEHETQAEPLPRPGIRATDETVPASA